MIIRFEGRAWEFDMEQVTLQQAMTVQLHTGMSIKEWEESLSPGEDEHGEPKDPGPQWLKSLQCVYWLMKAQNGEKTPIADCDFVIAKFFEAMAEAYQAEIDRRKAEEAAKAPVDPTPPPSPPAGPPSPAPGTPTATTPPQLPVGVNALATA